MTNKPSPSLIDDEDDESDASLAKMANDHFDRCDCGRGFWTSMNTEIVYSCREGIDSSMPRDVYEDDLEYLRRSALHDEVLEPLRTLLELEAAERNHLNGMLAKGPQPSPVEQCRRHLKRLEAIRALMTAHRLTDSAD